MSTIQVIQPSQWQVQAKQAYTIYSTKPEWGDYAVQASYSVSLRISRMSWPRCPGTVWEPIRETSSYATRQKTLVPSCLSSLTHCKLILGLESGIGVRDLIPTKKKKEGKRNDSFNLAPYSSHEGEKPSPGAQYCRTLSVGLGLPTHTFQVQYTAVGFSAKTSNAVNTGVEDF